MSTTPISAISALDVSQALAGTGLDSLSATGATTGATSSGSVTGTSFPDLTSSFPDVTGAIDALQATQSEANALAVQAVTGDLDDVHDYTIAAAQASVTLELTAAVRNKAVEAFSEIMRMQA